MDAPTTSQVRPPSPAATDDYPTRVKIAEHLLDGLKIAIETPGEHRLFRWGKLKGLFPSRVGASGAAATRAVRENLIEITRTETRGKLVVEWGRATPSAMAFVHDHDSPKAVLRELRAVLGATRGAVPAWMEQARDETAQLALRFEHRAREILERLESLNERVEAALHRMETAPPTLSPGMAMLVPWGVAALEYLDRRADTVPGDCPLPDLFRAMQARFPDLTLPAYQDGLQRLHDGRALILLSAGDQPMSEPEFAFVVESRLVWLIRR